MLEASGYDVVEASMARTPCTKQRESRPNLVLVDIQMPRLDGYGVLAALRADPQLSDIPVVALTAFAMQGDSERAMAAGFDAYITKPVEIAGLRQRRCERIPANSWQELISTSRIKLVAIDRRSAKP